MAILYSDEWAKPEVREANLNGDDGAVDIVIPDGDWEDTVTFDNVETFKAWLAELNAVAEWFLAGLPTPGA